MRPTGLVLAIFAGAVAFAASAQPAPDQARDDFQAELARQCPDKQLQMLPAGALRDGLDDYMSGLTDQARSQLQATEKQRCSSMDAGAACVNEADLAAADQIGSLGDVAGSICGFFNRCTSEGVCDYAH